ncbi:MAG: hypothetical protein JW951_06305 [Lentisphaerae bacterium]|nr:hypothetical protein [Lentisphaerota bacterium]
MERWIKMIKRLNIGVGAAVILLGLSAPLVLAGSAQAQDTAAPAATVHKLDEAHLTAEGHAQIRCWAFLAAAVATGIGSLAAGYAVGHVGAAAMGAVAEKPELMGKSLIYVALAEGIAIYGLLIAIIVLAKV